jgi:hypothetical protein
MNTGIYAGRAAQANVCAVLRGVSGKNGRQAEMLSHPGLSANQACLLK